MNNIYVITEDNRLGKPSRLTTEWLYGIGADGKVEMENWAAKANKTGKWNKLRVTSLDKWENEAGQQAFIKLMGITNEKNSNNQ